MSESTTITREKWPMLELWEAPAASTVQDVTFRYEISSDDPEQVDMIQASDRELPAEEREKVLAAFTVIEI